LSKKRCCFIGKKQKNKTKLVKNENPADAEKKVDFGY
jgi:hypothetical protein